MTKTAIQYVSDLELDSQGYDYHIPTAAPILLLGGNTGRLEDYEKYRKFLAVCCAQYDHVLLVLGSREFSGITHDEGLRYAAALADDERMHDKLIIMHQARFNVPGSDVTILGCTLHSHLHGNTDDLPDDYLRTPDWSIERHNQRHENDLTWLRESIYALHETTRKVVVLTHDAPSAGLTCPPGQSLSWCSNALDDLPKYERAATVDYWIFGHTGWNTKFHAERTIVLSNQRCVEDVKLSWWKRRTVRKVFDPKATITL